MTVTHGRDLTGDLALDCDDVVVGSGAGAAVVACHLAESGRNVVVLEEGGHIEPHEFARMRPTQAMRHSWRDAGLTMAVPLGDSPAINVMMGRCIGGSSAMTGGVCFRTPDYVLADWRKLGLAEFTPEAMEPYFLDVEKSVHVEEVPESMRSRSTALFAAGAAKLGYRVEPMRRNTNGCIGWATCNFGCPEGAKMSVDRSYLPRAIAAGARVYSDAWVERVRVDGSRATGIDGWLLNTPNGKPGSRLSVRARRVVVGAGAFYTPLILQRSGIGRRSGELGKNLTLHPGFRVMARFEERVEGWKGALQSAFSSAYEPEGIQLNSLFVPGGILAATMPGIGDRHRARALAIPHLAMFGANLHDAGNGRVRKGLGRDPFVTYRMSAHDRATARRALRICADTFLAAGAKEIFLPVLGMDGMDADRVRAFDFDRIPARRFECASQHPLGTCRMGTSETNSVVNQWGAAWDVSGLHLVDGSIVPTSLGVNPQLSIMTLATRIAWQLREAN
jgi:choline dehydrogenase-like flavoprotein